MSRPCNHCLGSTSSNVDRRTVLRGAGQTTLATAIAAAGISYTPVLSAATPVATAGRQSTQCQRLQIASAIGTQVEVVDSQCDKSCECEGSVVFTSKQNLIVVLDVAGCVEASGPTIPPSSTLSVNVARTYRAPGPDGTWVGTHEGEFELALPTGTFRGRISGTDGLTSEDGSCRDPQRDEGILIGRGSEGFAGCSFVATYRGKVEIGNDQDPCSIDWSTWQPVLAGVITCSCGEGCIGIGFESLPLGNTYVVGNTFSDGGATMTVEQFQWGGGAWTAGGYARVENGGQAGGSGQDLQVNNVNISFDFGGTVNSVQLSFGEYGGNLNIEINGTFQNFNRFADIDGTTIGGVTVSVTGGSVTGVNLGTLLLTGPISSLWIGGQELWIDDVCYG